MDNKTEQRMIQLPPLPEDLPAEAVGIIWTLEQMNDEERRDAVDFIESFVNEKSVGPDFARMTEITEKYIDCDEAYFNKIIHLIKKMISSIISGALHTTGVIYQKVIIEGQDVESVAKEHNVPVEFVENLARYYQLENVMNESESDGLS